MSTNNTDKDENGASDNESSGLAMAGIAGVVGVAIGAGLAYFFGGSNESPQCSAANGPRGGGRNTSSAPSSTFRNRDVACESCAVCLDSICSVTVLPCTHRFHTSCIRPWLSKQRTCPTCRAPVPRDSEVNY